MNYGGMGWTYTLKLVKNIPGLKLIFDTGNPVGSLDRSAPKPYPTQSSWDFYSHVKEHIAYVHIKDGVYDPEKNEVTYTYPGRRARRRPPYRERPDRERIRRWNLYRAAHGRAIPRLSAVTRRDQIRHIPRIWPPNGAFSSRHPRRSRQIALGVGVRVCGRARGLPGSRRRSVFPIPITNIVIQSGLCAQPKQCKMQDAKCNMQNTGGIPH